MRSTRILPSALSSLKRYVYNPTPENSVQAFAENLQAYSSSKKGCVAIREMFEGGLKYQKSRIQNHFLPTERLIGITNLKERSSLTDVTAYVTTLKKKNMDCIMIRDKSGKVILGRADVYHPSIPDYPDSKIKNYLDKAIEIDDIWTRNNGVKASEYSGIGTKLLKEAVKMSKKQGYDGKIYLVASNERSPVPFYYSRGLRFFSDEQNKMMETFLKNTEKSKVMPEELNFGLMYLPEENIPFLLSL